MNTNESATDFLPLLWINQMFKVIDWRVVFVHFFADCFIDGLIVFCCLNIIF